MVMIFAKQAVENGAKALLVSRKLDVNVSQILVPDTLEALFEFAAKYRDMLSMEVISITGSNGKTSTKDMLLSVLGQNLNTVATYENQKYYYWFLFNTLNVMPQPVMVSLKWDLMHREKLKQW